MTTARQKFLKDHPYFAQANAKQQKAWLAAHPSWAGDWHAANAPAGTKKLGNPVIPDKAKSAFPSPAGKAAAQPATAAPAPDLGKTAEGQSAKALIGSTLATYGLPPSLADWAWNEFVKTGNTDQVFLELRDRPEYKQRFAGMDALRAKGRAISESQYIQAEQSYAATMHAAGLPAGFYDDPSDFSKLIAGEVAPAEFNDRVQMAAQVVASDPRGQQMRDELGRLYGMNNATGLAIAYWIDPEKGTDLIKRQFTAAQLASESTATGFGSLTKDQAEKVGALGVTSDAARQTFSQLAGMHELQTGLAGDAGDAGVSQDTMVNAAFTGNADAQNQLTTAARRRTAAFDGGSAYASGQNGLSGLGSAAT